MRRLLLLVVVILLLVLPIVYAEGALSVQVAYCTHMGYSVGINSENKPKCVFNDGSLCDATDFYKGFCGQDKVKEIPPRKEGQTVYVEFEKCEEGLIPSEPKYLLDQPVCYKPTWFEKLLMSLGLK